MDRAIVLRDLYRPADLLRAGKAQGSWFVESLLATSSLQQPSMDAFRNSFLYAPDGTGSETWLLRQPARRSSWRGQNSISRSPGGRRGPDDHPLLAGLAHPQHFRRRESQRKKKQFPPPSRPRGGWGEQGP